MPVNKVRRNGSYAPLSAHYYLDDAIGEAGEKAEVLYCRGLAFCANVVSDGLISDRQILTIGVGLPGLAARADTLVKVGLWERVDGGYRVRSWLKWNRSREEIIELAERDTTRKRVRLEPDPPSERNPNGIHAEPDPPSERNPRGTRPDSNPRARTPRNSTTRNSTTRQDSDRTPAGPVRSESGGTPPQPPPAEPPPARGAAGGSAEPAAHPPPTALTSNDPGNPDWRSLPAYGTPRPADAAQRARNGAATARQAIPPPTPAAQPPPAPTDESR